MLLCFAVVVFASIYKTAELDSVPNSTKCNIYIPQLYANSLNTAQLSGGMLSNSVIFKGGSGSLAALNQQCAIYYPDAFYAIYVYNGHQVGNYR